MNFKAEAEILSHGAGQQMPLHRKYPESDKKRRALDHVL